MAVGLNKIKIWTSFFVYDFSLLEQYASTTISLDILHVYLLCAGFSVTPTSAYDLAQRIYSAVSRCQLVYNSGHKNETICLRTV